MQYEKPLETVPRVFSSDLDHQSEGHGVNEIAPRSVSIFGLFSVMCRSVNATTPFVISDRRIVAYLAQRSDVSKTKPDADSPTNRQVIQF